MGDGTRRSQRAIVILSCILVVMNLFYKSMPAVLSVDFLRDFALSATGLSAISGATMLGFGIMQIPSGVLTDFWGGRNSLTALFSLAALCTLLFASVSSVPLAIALRFATGVGIAVTVPCLALLAQWFSGPAFVRANGVLLAFGSLGPLVASAPLAYTATAFGWRSTIFGAGLFSLLLALLVWKIIPASPPSSGLLERQPLSLGAVAGNVRAVLRRRIFWALAACIACGPGMGMAFTALWWGPYLMQGCGFSQTQTGNILMLIFLLGCPAMPLAGWIYSARLPDRRILLRILFALALLPMGALIWASGRHVAALHVAIGVAFMYTLSGGLAVMYASMRELFPLRMVGTALGCLNTLLPVSAMTVQMLVGLVLERSGAATGAHARAFAVSLLVLALFPAVGLITACCMPDEPCRDEKDG